MPKKRTPAYTQAKPSYVHPSLQRRSSEPGSSTAPQTVNERIQQLRREQAPRTTAQQRDDLIDVVTKRTIPPHLRRLLQMAEVDSPRPKPGNRSRAPRAGPRPPPGPAAPSSWLARSGHAPDHIKNLRKYLRGERDRPQRLSALAKLHYTECRALPPTRSLVHQCLKTFALHWDELIEYEQHYIGALPEPLKETLLSYLSVYGAEGCLDLESVKILFAKDGEVQGGSGSERIRFLDLTGLLNPSYRLTDLSKSLSLSQTRSSNTTVTGGLASLSLDSPKGKGKAPVDVADSWEDEADDEHADVSADSLSLTLSIPLFPNLTRLSLAHPGANASWSGLLAMSKHLKTLTHLSLAYWPMPSTTPNAATASMESRHANPVALGGSNFYSELDDDWHEATNILRRLSLNTYCLKWLDLEGCSWHKALAWDHPSLKWDRLEAAVEALNSGTQTTWTKPISQEGPDWNGAWRQIEYLNLFQGWIPSDTVDLTSRPAGLLTVQLLGWLRQHGDNPEQNWKLRDYVGMQDVGDWMAREEVARTVEQDIRAARKMDGGKWCRFDHGWHASSTALGTRGDQHGSVAPNTVAGNRDWVYTEAGWVQQ